MAMDLYQLSQAQVNGAWNQPRPIATIVGPQIVAAQNLDGRIDVLTIADGGTLYRSSETAAGSQTYWAPVSLNVQAKTMALGRNQDGRLNCVYVAPDDSINQIVQDTANAATWTSSAFGGQAKKLTMARNADGRLELMYVGLDDNIYDFWQTSANSGLWQGGIFRGKAKALALATNKDGRLELIYVGMDHGLYHNWQPQPSSGPWQGGVSGAQAAGLGGFAKDLTVALNSSGKLEFFYIGTDDAIYHNWQDADGWHGEAAFGGSAQQLCLGQDQDGRFDLFYVGMDGYTYHNWQASLNGPWTGGTRGNMASRLACTTDAQNRIALFFAGYGTPPTGTVAAPARTTGNYNCFIANNGSALENASVEIDVTTAIAVTSNGAPLPGQPTASGLSWQMNCYAPSNYLGNWQQYVVGFTGTTLYWQINNWESLSTIVVNVSGTLATVSGGKVPAGTKITIALRTDADSRVNGATFSVADGTGKSLGSHVVDLTETLDPVELAPIVAFEMNLVGPGSGESAVLGSGGGSFRYGASTALTALTNAPDYLAVANIITAETANVTYGTISATPARTLTQTFAVATGVTSVPPVKGKTRPPLHQPPGLR